MARQPDGFLGRWAQRKQEARKEEERTVTAVPETTAAPVPDAAPDIDLESMPEAEALAHLGLPDPDDLKIGDDFKQFLTSSVPKAIRQRALRRLWTSNPVLANLDGLNDYEQDFTDAATVVKNLSTSYVVGEGFVKRVTEAVDKVSEDMIAESEPETPEEAPLAVVRSEDRTAENAPAEPERQAFVPESDDNTEIPEVSLPRRMKFSVD